MLKKLLIAFSLLLHFGVYAQLADGSTAPDFTLTDYNGIEHNLYSYLDADITVIVEIFAAHCPNCWAYHQTNTLKNLYNTFGPDGTNEVMVLTLEHDQWNGHDAFIGVGPAWVTQGNWLEGTPFPIFNVEDPDRGVFDDYNVVGYPVVYKICPNKIVERISTSVTTQQIYEEVQACQLALSINEITDLGDIYYDAKTGNLTISAYEKVRSIRVMTVTGQVVRTTTAMVSNEIHLGHLQSGIYLFEIRTDNTTLVRKFYLD